MPREDLPGERTRSGLLSLMDKRLDHFQTSHLSTNQHVGKEDRNPGGSESWEYGLPGGLVLSSPGPP